MKGAIILALVAITTARSYDGSYGGYGPTPVPTTTPIPIVRESMGSGYGGEKVVRQPYQNPTPAILIRAPAAPSPNYNHYDDYTPKADFKPVEQPIIRIHYALPESAIHAPAPLRNADRHADKSTLKLGEEQSEANELSAPKSAPESAPFIPTLRFDEEIKEGSYITYDFEAANGIRQKDKTSILLLPESEQNRSQGNSNGAGKSEGEEKWALITKTGSFAYTSPDGKRIELSYVADKDGFRPVGAHLPTPPPLPEANVRAAAIHLAEVARVRALEDSMRAKEGKDDATVKHAELAAQAVHAAPTSDYSYNAEKPHRSAPVAMYFSGY